MIVKKRILYNSYWCRYSQIDRHTEIKTGIHINEQPERTMDIQTDINTDRQETDGKRDRMKDIQT